MITSPGRASSPVSALWLFMFAAFFASTLVSADNTSGSFTTPAGPGSDGDFTNNAVYKLGDSLQVEWDTLLDAYQINLWQQSTDRSFANRSQAKILGA